MSTLTSVMPTVNERDIGIDSGSDNSGSYSDSYYSEQQNENMEEEFEIRTTSAMRISSTNEYGSNNNAFNNPTDDNTASLLDRIVVLSSSLLFAKSQSKPYPPPQQQVKLQQLQLQKQHNKSLSTLATSAITEITRTTTSAAAASAASIILSLRMIPKDVLSNEILDFLSDKSIKRFLSCLGERRVKSDLYKLDQRFCFKHGSKLEDSNQFHIIVNTNTQRTMVDNEEDDDEKDENPFSSSSSSTTITPTMKQELPQQPSPLCLSCPECYAEKQHTKRCHSCRKFYPKFFLNSNSSNNTNTNQTTTATTNINSSTAGPGLWCQQCDRMAFCNACLSNDIDGCGSSKRINDGEDIEDDDDDDDDDNNNNNNVTPVIASRKILITTSIAPFGAFGRHKRLRNYCSSRSNTTKGRITCHNCCCPNVFTNTMCGEFICGDCGEQHIKKSTTAITKGDGDGDGDNNDTTTNPIGVVEVCDECGKATCLDPNCLVCTDFRLINICCSFNPEDAYKFNFFGYGNNNNNNNGLCGGRADSFTKLRHYIVDSTIYIGFIVILYNMWWYHLNQEQEQQEHQDFVPGGGL